jgi:hypothetical protein
MNHDKIIRTVKVDYEVFFQEMVHSTGHLNFSYNMTLAEGEELIDIYVDFLGSDLSVRVSTKDEDLVKGIYATLRSLPSVSIVCAAVAKVNA